jgi:hypothetical protein
MKARGRPPIGDRDKPARLHVTVSPADYDRAYERARREGISVPELARRGLARELADDDGDDD